MGRESGVRRRQATAVVAPSTCSSALATASSDCVRVCGLQTDEQQLQCGQFERNNGQDNTNFSTVVYQHEVNWSQSKEPEGDIPEKETERNSERGR